MLLLLSVFWPAIAVALGLGTLTGWLSGAPSRAVLAGLIGTLALLAALALAELISGSGGLMVESGALMLAAYLVGCEAGSLIPGLGGSRAGGD